MTDWTKRYIQGIRLWIKILGLNGTLAGIAFTIAAQTYGIYSATLVKLAPEQRPKTAGFVAAGAVFIVLIAVEIPLLLYLRERGERKLARESVYLLKKVRGRNKFYRVVQNSGSILKNVPLYNLQKEALATPEAQQEQAKILAYGLHNIRCLLEEAKSKAHEHRDGERLFLITKAFKIVDNVETNVLSLLEAPPERMKPIDAIREAAARLKTIWDLEGIPLSTEAQDLEYNRENKARRQNDE